MFNFCSDDLVAFFAKQTNKFKNKKIKCVYNIIDILLLWTKNNVSDVVYKTLAGDNERIVVIV